jgi:competence protein ComEA
LSTGPDVGWECGAGRAHNWGMRQRLPEHDEQLARARLAFLSAGQRPLSSPRHALDEPHSEPEEIDADRPPARSWGDRLQLSRSHLLALAVVGLVVVFALGLAWTRAAAETLPASPPPITSEAPLSAPTPLPAPSETPRQLRAHVLGGVASQGVVRLEEGAIVADAIEAAGGFNSDAVPGDLNLAAPVSDGMQIQVGTAESESRVEGAQPRIGSPGAAGGSKLDLNTATAAELETLPGVGPVTAAAIVGWREEHGSFTSTTELQEISGIGPKTFAKLEPLVTV